MSAPTWPRPVEILAYYQRVREALHVLDRQFIATTAEPRSQFYGLSREEFGDLLTRTVEELDEQVVMALVASGEATLRRDFKARLHRKTKDDLRPRFKELERAFGERVALDDILEVWKDKSGHTDRIGRFKQLVQRRHWLAHGRHWSDKSGVAPDPPQAWFVIDDLLQTLNEFLPDFPLL